MYGYHVIFYNILPVYQDSEKLHITRIRAPPLVFRDIVFHCVAVMLPVTIPCKLVAITALFQISLGIDESGASRGELTIKPLEKYHAGILTSNHKLES